MKLFLVLRVQNSIVYEFIYMYISSICIYAYIQALILLKNKFFFLPFWLKPSEKDGLILAIEAYTEADLT